MRILSAARLGEVNTNELRNKSNATTFTPLVSLIFFLHRSPFSDRTRELLKSDQVTLSNCNKFLRLDRNSASFSRGNTALSSRFQQFFRCTCLLEFISMEVEINARN